MNSVCLYFQIHQPFRLRSDYRFFDIGRDHNYFNESLNQSLIRRISDECYIPTNEILLQKINELKGKFKVTFSISGMALEQFEKYSPHTITSFKKLADTGCVEFLAETYYHSLAYNFSEKEFAEQIAMHSDAIKRIFNVKPTSFRNTELIYDNRLATIVEKAGYDAVLTEGANQILGWKNPNFVYQPKPCKKLKILLRNFTLSDDLAFRFTNRGWADYPLTTEKYASWIHKIAGAGEVVNLFMDYETFGEHHKRDTGIFEFIAALPNAVLANEDFTFATISEAANKYNPMAKIDVPYTISWADMEKDVTAWTGNDLQNSSLEMLYSIEKNIKALKNSELLDTWRKLQTSDHFYYMCTKWASDGAVHTYFNPYRTAEDAFVIYNNVLNDLDILQKRMTAAKKNKIPNE